MPDPVAQFFVEIRIRELDSVGTRDQPVNCAPDLEIVGENKYDLVSIPWSAMLVSQTDHSGRALHHGAQAVARDCDMSRATG